MSAIPWGNIYTYNEFFYISLSPYNLAYIALNGRLPEEVSQSTNRSRSQSDHWKSDHFINDQISIKEIWSTPETTNLEVFSNIGCQRR